jgi:hypothetical protein
MQLNGARTTSIARSPRSVKTPAEPAETQYSNLLFLGAAEAWSLEVGLMLVPLASPVKIRGSLDCLQRSR